MLHLLNTRNALERPFLPDAMVIEYTGLTNLQSSFALHAAAKNRFSAHVSRSKDALGDAATLVNEFKDYLPAVIQVEEGIKAWAKVQGTLKGGSGVDTKITADEGQLDKDIKTKLAEFALRFQAISKNVETVADGFEELKIEEQKTGFDLIPPQIVRDVALTTSTFGVDLASVGRSIELALELYPSFFIPRLEEGLKKVDAIGAAAVSYQNLPLVASSSSSGSKRAIEYETLNSLTTGPPVLGLNSVVRSGLSTHFSKSKRTLKDAAILVKEFNDYLPAVIEVEKGEQALAKAQGKLKGTNLVDAKISSDENQLDKDIKTKLAEFALRFQAISKNVETVAGGFEDYKQDTQDENATTLIQDVATTTSALGVDLGAVGRSIGFAVDCYPSLFVSRLTEGLKKLEVIGSAADTFQNLSIPAFEAPLEREQPKIEYGRLGKLTARRTAFARNSSANSRFSAHFFKSKSTLEDATELVNEFKDFLPAVIKVEQGERALAKAQGKLKGSNSVDTKISTDESKLDKDIKTRLAQFALRFQAVSRNVETVAGEFEDYKKNSTDESESSFIEDVALTTNTIGVDLGAVGRSVQLAIDCYPSLFVSRLEGGLRKLDVIGSASETYQTVSL